MQSTSIVPTNYLLSFFFTRKRTYQFAAFAFITTQKKGEVHYLLQWNEKWHCFNFIGGKLDNRKGDNDDLACTMKREIQEEIGIGYLDGVVAIEQNGRVCMSQFSQREHRFKDYSFHIFKVHFFPNMSVDQRKVTHSLLWLTSHNKNIYVSEQEVRNLRTKDGRPISKTVYRILKTIGEIN